MKVKELLNGLTAAQKDDIKCYMCFGADMKFPEIENYATALKQNIVDSYIPRLMMHCGDFDTLFNSVEDFDLYHLEWLRLNSFNWGRYFRTVVVKYNLIHNTDKTQEETISIIRTGEGYSTSNDTSNVGGSGTITADNTDTENVVGKGSNLHQLSAANQTDFHNKNKDVTESEEDHNSTHKRNETSTNNVSTNVEQEQSYNNESVSEVSHKTRAYGNIGVTTNQQMLAEERKHLAFDMLDLIIGDFKKEFCIMIY